MSVIERWECDECGAVVPTEDGHVHVEVDDAYTASPATLKRYVPAEQLEGAVDLLRRAHPYCEAATLPSGIHRARALADEIADLLATVGGQSGG